MISKTLAACGLALIVAGCGGLRGGPGPMAASKPVEAASADWRTIATPADRDRLRRWRDAWMQGLSAARQTNVAEIRAQGALFDPDRALTGAIPPAGAYRCRVFKLGAAGPAMLDYVAYPYFRCRVDQEGDMLSLYKEGGTQRPVGLLFADGDARAVFLGTLVLGDERAPLEYGQDADRDMAGFVERVEERRWRVVLPWPRFESKIDVVELVPA
ncbi:DUF4893 domain-containing protein [Sphingomonas sp. 37zxx]|uniref:DUF4893 domain-containing protein n=1 Tax=Sphingomonas sp. 37zxx TaxID=1550073 RepID=UPI00053C067C|nr:DUF4893 domain-containing protein [Sphingomonas sp. 37zxx]